MFGVGELDESEAFVSGFGRIEGHLDILDFSVVLDERVDVAARPLEGDVVDIDGPVVPLELQLLLLGLQVEVTDRQFLQVVFGLEVEFVETVDECLALASRRK